MSVQALSNLAPRKNHTPGNQVALFAGTLVKGLPAEEEHQPVNFTFRKPLEADVFELNAGKSRTANVKPAIDIADKLGDFDVSVSAVKTEPGYGSGDTHSGEDLKVLLDDLNFFDRKIAAHYFLKKASPIEFSQPVLDASRIEPRLKSDLIDIAENLEVMSNAEKVEFVKDLTGSESSFARYAEKVLVYDANPGFKETLKLLKPDIKEKSLEGYKNAFSGLGMGLMMMPLVLGGKMLFNPNLLGRFVAGTGLILV